MNGPRFPRSQDLLKYVSFKQQIYLTYLTTILFSQMSKQTLAKIYFMCVT